MDRSSGHLALLALGFCFVRGNLNKRVLVGGQCELPGRNATVEV
jgi:hypothetical protein